ncbi:MAG: hypothetical protein WC662_04265 [Candidatus Paceibacterota bacterium]|jgi:hypothetical protein
MGEKIDTTKIISINEQPISPGKFIPFEENLKIAEQLLEKYKKEIKNNLQRDVDGWYGGEENTRGGYQESIKHYMEETPNEILEHYTGHGVTKGHQEERVASLLSIASNKSIKGSFGGFGKKMVMWTPYTDAEIFVLSPKDQNMQIRTKKTESGLSEPIFNEDRSWKANIGAIVIDVKYYPLFEELKTMFPDVNIIKANQLPEYFGIKKE